MQNAEEINEKSVVAQEDGSLRVKMTNDKYFADFVANKLNTQTLFQMFLPKHILEELDLSTLRTVHTRDVGSDGVEKVGDMYFVVDMKNRVGRSSRRAVFVIAAEHKTKDDRRVAIQLLGYVSALLDRMNADPKSYEDENGLFPTPYVVVFSQDEHPKEQPVRLGDILWSLPGLEGTVPNFDYQTIYVNQIPLEVIRECEPAMRAFLYLTQIANKEHTPEEDAELASTIRQILEASPSDERLSQCAYASLNYLLHLQKRRPGMPSLSELRKEIEKQKGEPMENGVLLFFEKEVSERCEKAREDGWQDGMQAGMQTGMQTGMQIGKQEGIYEVIYRNLSAKYGKNSVSSALKKKLDAINYYPALEEIQLAILTTPSLDAFKRKLTRIVNKYKDEIQEVRR